MSLGVVKGGGLAGLAAAGLLVLSALLHEIPGQSLEVPGASSTRIVITLAFVAVVVAVLGLHRLHQESPRYGWWGTLGAALAGLGYAVVAGVTAVSMVRDVEYLLTLRMVGAALVLVGSALLGAAVLHARLIPWWCGVLLIVAFPLGDVANVLYPTAENVILAALWGTVGTAMLARSGAGRHSLFAQVS